VQQCVQIIIISDHYLNKKIAAAMMSMLQPVDARSSVESKYFILIICA